MRYRAGCLATIIGLLVFTPSSGGAEINYLHEYLHFVSPTYGCCEATVASGGSGEFYLSEWATGVSIRACLLHVSLPVTDPECETYWPDSEATVARYRNDCVHNTMYLFPYYAISCWGYPTGGYGTIEPTAPDGGPFNVEGDYEFTTCGTGTMSNAPDSGYYNSRHSGYFVTFNATLVEGVGDFTVNLWHMYSEDEVTIHGVIRMTGTDLCKPETFEMDGVG